MGTHTTTGFPYRVSRVLGATAARAWEAYTTAAERQEWFGAEEGSAELDVRVGGVWECVLLGPDGGRTRSAGPSWRSRRGAGSSSPWRCPVLRTRSWG